MSGDVGIVSYGHYVPRYRLDMRVLAEQWGLSETHERMLRLNGRNAMSVPALDEDVVTLSIDAAERALALVPAGMPAPRSLIVGSESHPYAVKPSAVIVAEALGLTPDLFAVDVEFACKGGTAAAALSLAAVAAGQVEGAVAIGADCPQSAPGSLLEASVGAGACALVVGRQHVIARLDATAAASSDVSDFWRRDTAQFPSVVGRFSSEVGYMEHSCRVITRLLETTATRPEDYAHLCLHQPYQSLPLAVAKRLGFQRRQVQASLTSARIGNTYSSACLLSLAAVLDIARPGERVLVTSYGSGAGSDGFVFTVTDEIEAFHARARERGVAGVADQLGDGHVEYLTYGRYCLMQGKLRP